MTSYPVTVTDGAKFSSAPSYLFGVVASDSIVTHESLARLFQAGGFATDTFEVHEVHGIKMIYVPDVHEGILMRAALIAAFPVSASSGMVLSSSPHVLTAVHILDKLLEHDAASPAGMYHITATSKMALFGAVFRSLGGFISETIGFNAMAASQRQAIGNVASGVHLSEVLHPWLLFEVSVGDDFDLTDVDVVNAIYHGEVTDEVRMTVSWVNPGGTVSTWVINTRTGAVTEYDNFAFNSMTRMGNVFIGANEQGIWRLDGETDGGTSIATSIKSGLSSLGGSRFTSFAAAYLGLRIRDNARDVFLKLRSGTGKEYVYAVRPQDMATTRVNFGKGLRSRYWSWELKTIGADYDFDAIEFIPLISKRRVD